MLKKLCFIVQETLLQKINKLHTSDGRSSMTSMIYKSWTQQLHTQKGW